MNKLETMVKQFGNELKTKGLHIGKNILYHANPLNDLDYARKQAANPDLMHPLEKHFIRGFIISYGIAWGMILPGAVDLLIDYSPLHPGLTGVLIGGGPVWLDIAQYYVRSAIDNYLKKTLNCQHNQPNQNRNNT